jgi:tRNA threonylcarbamoyladenosine biosynthesis protein TsaB
MLLAVETSGMTGSVALADDQGLIVEHPLLTAGPRHAQTLVAEIDALLRAQHLAPGAITKVAVSIGPGSFTGLRVGLVFAKTFAWLNGAQLYAVDTLRAIAQQAPSEIALVTSVIDAQRSEVFTATYRWNQETGIREAIDRVHVSALADLPTASPFIGPGLNKHRETLKRSHLLLDESLCEPRASSIATIGLHMARLGQTSLPETLEPVYVRLSYAEEQRPQSV